MDQSNVEIATALNGLLESTYDSVEGFLQAANLARNPSFQALFRRKAEERQSLITELTAEVRSFGGDPVCDGTMLGDAHRVFTKARDILAHGSDRAVIDEVVRGQGLVERRFDDAMRAEQLPPHVHELATRASAQIKTDRDEIAALAEQFS